MLSVNPRRLLVAEAGHVLLSLDYSQLEVRLMAHFSQDPRFVQILHGGGDVFRHVAAGWLRKPEDQVTAEERSGAKRICYGLIYGISAGRLAVELGISRAQAQDFQESFMREYAGVAAWVRSCSEQARRCGYVETLGGRRRFLPALAASGAAERSHAERQAVNTSCQASAADLVRLAMLGIHERLKEFRLHEVSGPCRMSARLLLQIHDELLLEVHESWLDRVRDMVIDEMIGVGRELLVPLQVKWKVGRTWGSLES
jgi:DNA polymerase theta